MMKILVLDDDVTFLQSMQTVLKGRGYAKCVSEKQNFIRELENEKQDLVITDYKLCFWDGLEVIRHVKGLQPKLPIILLSGHIDRDMAIKCANLKIHKLLEKPLELAELYKALDEVASNASTPMKSLCYGPMVLTEDKFLVTLGTSTTQLTEIEFKILRILVENIDRRVNRIEFQEKLWPGTNVSSNTLDTHLLNLKRKLPLIKRNLLNVRGHGYYLTAFSGG